MSAERTETNVPPTEEQQPVAAPTAVVAEEAAPAPAASEGQAASTEPAVESSSVAVAAAAPAEEPNQAEAEPTATAADATADAAASSAEKRKRARSHSRDGHHHHEGGATAAEHHHKVTREERSDRKPQALSAAAKKESELSADTCVRFGIFEPRREISKEEFMDEMDAIRMTNAVETIVLEPFVPGQDQYFWARIYFNSPENADIAATELNIPLRKSKWRLSVTQRLPLKGAGSGEMGTIPAFQPFVCDPVDTVVVDTQEGYVAFSTDELYLSRSATEFIDAKRNGRLIRRLICKHFDSERRIPCRYGVGCSFMHIKATAANRLLRTVGHRAPLRFTKQDEDIQVGTWEYERRHDTLLVRHLGEEMTQTELSYMFSNCAGFVSCSVFANKDEKNNRIGSRFGLIRFDSKATAMATLLQTFDSGLNIGFFGVMEDIRRMQMHSVKDQKLLPSFDSTQQTHIFFSPITNQVIGLAERSAHHSNNFNNNNRYNNNAITNNQHHTANNYNNGNNNNNNRYNNNNNNGFNNNNNTGFNRYNNNNNNNNGHSYGNDRYNNMNNNGGNRYNNNNNNNGGFNNNRYNNNNDQGRVNNFSNDRYNNNNNANNINGGFDQQNPSVNNNNNSATNSYGGASTSPYPSHTAGGGGSDNGMMGNNSNAGVIATGAENHLFAPPPANNRNNNAPRDGNSNNGGSAGATPSGPVPFPPLPAGWGYGVSRRNGKYYFFEHGSKAPTTFKHPVTGEKYGGN